MVRAVSTKDLLILAPSGHAHLCILRPNVCRSGLAPAVGAGIHVAEVNDFIDALQLRPAHGLVVVSDILAELHCRLQALSLCRAYREAVRAVEHADAPVLQDLDRHVCIDVPGNGPHHCVADLLWADGHQGPPPVQGLFSG